MLIFKSQSDNKYIYNQVDNNIYPISNDLDELEITKLFKEHSPAVNVRFNGPEHGWETQGKSESLIINITDACNLRCSYCAYSEHYPYERKHNNAHISVVTAQKAIDEYIVRSEHMEIRRINLYGGEPTTNTNLIYQIVNYAKSKAKNIEFSINTNAYSMNNSWVSFVIDNNIQLQISIDGNQARHDKYRVAINGGGTFNRIKNNLQKIYDQSPIYYKENIIFLATMAPPYQLLELHNLYNCESLFQQPWSINFVRPIDTTFIDSIEEREHLDTYSKQQFILAKDYIEAAIENKAKEHFGHWVFGQQLKQIHFRDMDADSTEWINGCCTPGIDKFFVDSKGNYFPCERSGSFMKLGDVDSGLNMDNIQNIVHQYTLDCNEHCSKCPNLRFCDTCYLGSKRDNTLELERKYQFCSKRLEKLKLSLHIYVSALEYNSASFDHLDFFE